MKEIPLMDTLEKEIIMNVDEKEGKEWDKIINLNQGKKPLIMECI